MNRPVDCFYNYLKVCDLGPEHLGNLIELHATLSIRAKFSTNNSKLKKLFLEILNGITCLFLIQPMGLKDEI